jgi:hypothetical protein
MVLPTGTYRLSGTILDEGIRIAGARVEITNGASAGLSALDGTLWIMSSSFRYLSTCQSRSHRFTLSQ